MTFTIEQLELYVHAIDLYESDEAQWLRDKRLEKGGLLAMHNPEMTKIVLAVDDAKTELAVNSVEIARQLIVAKKELQRMQQGIEELRDSYMEDSGTVGSTQEEQIELDTHGETAKILTQILKGNA
ncbi:hypothetical protein SEA_PSONYX_57 [Corynebacterium phage PSonyx]|nr:hypothetical protein SEA_PSONYX_57 [Corynebacterium phage PSonyx]